MSFSISNIYLMATNNMASMIVFSHANGFPDAFRPGRESRARKDRALLPFLLEADYRPGGALWSTQQEFLESLSAPVLQ